MGSPSKQTRKTMVPLSGNKKITVYAGKKISNALSEVLKGVDLYSGVRLTQILEAVYKQGARDGRREVLDKVDALKAGMDYRNPGQPKKLKK